MKTKIKHSQEVIFLLTQYLIEPDAPQVPPYDAQQMAQALAEALARLVFPLLVQLDGLMDKRLVRTFLATIQVLITFGDRVNGLLLSELGGYLETPDKAPAGTKRLWGRLRRRCGRRVARVIPAERESTTDQLPMPSHRPVASDLLL